MRAVSRFEANLLRILHCFMGHGEVGAVLSAIVESRPRPNCLSRDAAELVQQTLAKGTVMLLTRAGGWLQQRHLRDDQIREGSLWQRANPGELGLTFSPASLDFLMWVTAANASKPTTGLLPNHAELTNGDQFLIYRAVRTLRNTTVIRKWFRNGAIRSNALIALTMPDYFAESKSVPVSDFHPWMTGAGASVIEAMQDELAKTWEALERTKAGISQPEHMRALGAAQESVLNSLFDVAEQNGRRDLCRFLLETANSLLSVETHRERWIDSLDTADMRIAERTEFYESASTFLRATSRLRRWHTESLGVGYFDEGYAESQLWKSFWESSNATDSLKHAERVLKELCF